MAMESACIIQKLLWILISCCVAVAFSGQRSCDCMIRCGGRRTTTTRRFPSKSSLLLAEAEHVPVREKHVNQSKERWILLVEDEDDLRTAIGKFLATEGGYYVTGVSDARSAILVCRGIVRPNPSRSRFMFDPNFNQHLDGLGNNSTNNTTQLLGGPDCLVLDIRLGSMNGLELLKIIRSDPMLKGLPVVLLTGKGKVEDRILGYEVGADAYLPKPFDPEELLSIINGLMKDTLAVSGDIRGRTVQNDNANDVTYGGLKRELMEIKSLMQELGVPEREMQSDDSEENVSLNSLRGDLLEMKASLNQMGANDLPPKPQTSAHQFSSLSILTPEETEIISCVAQGMTNKDIATDMKCSVSKIEKRVSFMFNKAEVNKRSDLVSWWEKSLQGKATKTNDMETPDMKASEDKPSTLLTADETAVMDFLERGMTTEEIISKTRSTKRKIAKQLDNLFKKANVKSRTELVRWWRASRNEMNNV